MRALALVTCYFCMGLPGHAEDPADVAWQKTVVLRLAPDPTGKLALSATTEVEQTYLSARSTQATRFTVAEQYYATISNFRAYAQGKSLGSSAFGYTYPQRRDVFMSSTKLHHLDVPEGLTVGEKVTYSYTETFRDPAFVPLYRISDNGCVERFTLVVDHPADVQVDFRCFLPRGARPEITRPSSTRTQLAFGKLPRLEDLPHFEWNGLHAVVLPTFTRGDTPLNPVSPPGFAAWYRTLLGPEPEPTESLRKMAETLVAKAATPREKAKALFDFVKEKVRYAADERDMGAIVPRPPANVLARGYGDCKDKALLLATLGRICGLDLPMVLVAMDPSAELQEVHMGLFDHVINAFEDGGRRIFMDPTHPYVEFGNLPDSDIDKDALLLGPHPERLRIPPPERKPSVEIRVKAGLDDLKQGRAEVILRNGYLAMAREALRELRPLDVENRLSNALNGRLAKLSLDDFKLVEEQEGEARFEAGANLESFLTASTNRRYLPQAPFRTLDPELTARKGDALPIHLSPSPWMRLEVNLSGKEWKSLTEGWQAPGEGPFLAKARSLGDLRFEYEIRQDLHTAEGAHRPAFLAFLTELLQRRRNLFMLERSTP